MTCDLCGQHRARFYVIKVKSSAGLRRYELWCTSCYQPRFPEHDVSRPSLRGRASRLLHLS
jgi:hypothetical protein